MNLVVGMVIRGKYRVTRMLGRGGMGVVVGARHLALDQDVAIKVLLPEMLQHPAIVERFAREARAASKIQSDHVARVMDVDALEDGSPFIVMELLEGYDLSAVRKSGRPLAPELAVSHILEACEAIAEAHRVGIVHRDLKPANIFVATRGDGRTRVKVLDFGISKVGASDVSVTSTSTIVGSAEYMSPEQMFSARDVDARSDIWALGVTLFELVTARVPFKGESITEVCAHVLQRKPPVPSTLVADLPAGLDAVILKCLEKERENRYQTVAELMRALTTFARRGESMPSNPSMPSIHVTAPVAAFGPAPTVVGAELSSSRSGATTFGGSPAVESAGAGSALAPEPRGSELKTQVLPHGFQVPSPSRVSAPLSPAAPLVTDGNFAHSQPMLAAPVAAPRASNRGVLIGAVAALVMLGGAGAFFGLRGSSSSSPKGEPHAARSAPADVARPASDPPTATATTAPATDTPPPVTTSTVTSSTSPDPVESAPPTPTQTPTQTQPPPTTPTVKQPPPTTGPSKPPKPNCNPPYVIEPNGRKRPKVECL